MTRMSACSSSSPPTRRKRRSWSTRSSLTCITGLISPISSRKMVPFSATSSSPFLFDVGARERAAHVAEQLRLEQRLGHGAAVERHHRLVAPQRVEVDGLRDQALAGARLAGQQDRAVGARDRLDHLEDVEHRLASADDVRELVRQAERPLEQDVLLAELPVLDLLAHLHLEQVDVERLAQVVAGAEPHRFDRRLGRGERRDHDAEDVLVDLLRGAQHVDAAQVGHLDVGDQQVDRLALQRVDGGAAVLGEQHLVAFAAQHDRQQLPHRSLIVDDEDARRTAGRGGRRGVLGVGRAHVVTTARAGRLTETVVPAPGRELTWISPW